MISKNMIPLYFSFFLLIGCSTNAPNSLRHKNVSNIEEEKKPFVIEKIIEKLVYLRVPIYILESERESIPALDPSSVMDKTFQFVVTPSMWDGAIFTYDYIENHVYNVFMKPLAITEIILGPGEIIVGDPIISDSSRFLITNGESIHDGGRVRLYIKPTAINLTANLTINTSKRTYYFVLKTYKNSYMVGVKFNYHENGFVNVEATQKESTPSAQIPIQRLNFKYKINYTGRKPSWIPNQVFDDGIKTYFILPTAVNNMESPIIIGKGGQILNYRQNDNTYTVDKLIEKVLMRIGNKKVEIKRK